MNHTHYALFTEYDSRLVAVLPKDFTNNTITKALKDDTGADIESVTFDIGMLGRSMHTPLSIETEDYTDKFYLEPAWLYENE